MELTLERKRLNMELPISFDFKRITMPRLECTFLATPLKQDFLQSIRVDVLIVDDFNLKILLGKKLFSSEKINDSPKVDVIVEMIGDFKLNQKLGEIESVADVPALANMLAVIYPFLREKIHYCLANNNYSLLLSSVNFIDLVKQGEGKPGFGLTDARKNKQLELQDIK
jgi:hypothetical protein